MLVLSSSFVGDLFIWFLVMFLCITFAHNVVDGDGVSSWHSVLYEPMHCEIEDRGHVCDNRIVDHPKDLWAGSTVGCCRDTLDLGSAAVVHEF